DKVPIEVTVDLLRRPPGAAGEHLFDVSTLPDDLVCGDDEVGDRASGTFSVRLSQDGAGVCEHGPLAGFSGGQEHGRIGDRLPDAGGGHGCADVVHRVEDRRHRSQGAARGVDVHADRQVPAARIEVEQLCDDRVRHAVVDGHAEVDDAVAEQMRVD